MKDSAPPGGELARQFHADVAGPLLTRAMPGLRYAAGRLGSGSDVLGFDDAVAESLLADITDPQVTRLPAGIGSIEQWVSNVDVLAKPARRAALQASYRAWAALAEH